MQNSCENEFDLNENELTDEMHLNNNGFAQRLILTRGQRETRKWPIALLNNCSLTSIWNADLIFLKN